MKAAILVETGKPLVVADIMLPETLTCGQIQVRIHYSGICGTQINEIYAAKGEDKFLPHLLGHEGIGTVEKIGPGVSRVKLGDTVILHWRPASCGIQCQPPKYRWGDKTVNAGWVTTFNEQAIVSENRLTVLTEEIDSKIAPLFGCAITTGIGVINNDAQVKMGQSVVVLGLGGLGLNIAQAASMVGAHPVVGLDLLDNKLEMAKRFGLTHGISVGKQGSGIGVEQDISAEIREIVGEKGADVVIDTTGNTRLIEMAYELTHADGKTILVGVPKKGDNISIYSLPLHFNKVLTGSHGGSAVPDKDIPRYIKLLKAGKLQLDGLVTHEFTLDEVNQAIALVKSGAAGRVVLRMTDQ